LKPAAPTEEEIARAAYLAKHADDEETEFGDD